MFYLDVVYLAVLYRPPLELEEDFPFAVLQKSEAKKASVTLVSAAGRLQPCLTMASL